MYCLHWAALAASQIQLTFAIWVNSKIGILCFDTSLPGRRIVAPNTPTALHWDIAPVIKTQEKREIIKNDPTGTRFLAYVFVARGRFFNHGYWFSREPSDSGGVSISHALWDGMRRGREKRSPANIVVGYDYRRMTEPLNVNSISLEASGVKTFKLKKYVLFTCRRYDKWKGLTTNRHFAQVNDLVPMKASDTLDKAHGINELIPQKKPFLFIDKIKSITDCRATGTFVIKPQDFSDIYKAHFPLNPTLPGIFMLESLGQLCCAFITNDLNKRLGNVFAESSCKNDIIDSDVIDFDEKNCIRQCKEDNSEQRTSNVKHRFVPLLVNLSHGRWIKPISNCN